MSLSSTLLKMKSRGAFGGKTVANTDSTGIMAPNKPSRGRLAKKKTLLPAKDGMGR